MDHETANLLGIIVTQILATTAIIVGQYLNHKYNREKFHQNRNEIASVKEAVVNGNGKHCRYNNSPDQPPEPECKK